MRIVFMGTPDFAVPTLSEIISQGHEVVAVYSQPPRKAGRGMELKQSPVHDRAEILGIPVLTPLNFKDRTDIDIFKQHDADVAVVVAYGLLLPPEILEAPKFGCFNLHASVLPRWRGAAPINRAIMAGDDETGIMVMQMAEGLDTGPICMAEVLDIQPNMTAGQLHDELMVLGADLMVRALGGIERESLAFQEQDETRVTYASKLSKEETRIDWSKPGIEVHNHILGLSPFPGAWCEFQFGGKSYRLKVLKTSFDTEAKGEPGTILDDQLLIACGQGAVRLHRVQRSGKSAMDAEEFLLGNPLKHPMRLD